MNHTELQATLDANCYRVKSTGADTWQVSCPLPTHGQGEGDRNPSVTVTLSSDGNPLIHCHARCDQDEVFHAIMGIEPNANPPPPTATPPRGQRTTIDWPDHIPCAARNPDCAGASVHPIQGGIIDWPVMRCACGQSTYTDLLNLAAAHKDGITCRWKYAYSSGSHAYAVRHCQPDGSKQCYGNGTNSDLHIGKAEPITASGAEPIILAEGEKAAAALYSAGYSAATWRGGTQNTGHALYDWLRGRDVILWPDNDEPGRRAMNTAGKMTQDCDASSVSIIAIPASMPDKGDAADLPQDALKAALTNISPFVFQERHPDSTAGQEKASRKAITPREVWETLDVEWLLESGHFCVRASGDNADLMTLWPDGRWRAIPGQGKSLPRANITWLLNHHAPHRRNPNPDDAPPRSDNHWTRVISRLFDEMASLPKIQASRFNLPLADGPAILPIMSGGGYHTGTGKTISPDEMGKLRIAVPWQIPDPMPEPEDDGNDEGLTLIQEIVTGPLLPLAEAIAYSLAWTGKGIILLKWDATDVAKSTLADKAMRQMNDAVYHIASIRSLTTEGGFTGELAQVGVAKVIIVDEIEKVVTAIYMPDVERFCARLAEIHLKRVDPYQSPRTGAGIWMGNDWPKLPWGKRGLVGTDSRPGRADFAPILIAIPDDEARKYTPDEARAVMQSDAAGQWLQHWLLARAHQFAAAGTDFYDNAAPDTQAAIDAGRAEIRTLQETALDQKAESEGTHEIPAVIARMVYTGKKVNFVFVKDLKIAFGDPDREIPDGFNKALKEKYPTIPNDAFKRNHSRKIPGTKNKDRGMLGWCLLPENDPEATAEPVVTTEDGHTPGSITCPECTRDIPHSQAVDGKCRYCAAD